MALFGHVCSRHCHRGLEGHSVARLRPERGLPCVAIFLGIVACSCGSAPSAPPDPTTSTPGPTASSGFPPATASPLGVVKSDFAGYVVEAAGALEPMTIDVLRAQFGSQVQSALTSQASLRCGARAELKAATTRAVIRIGTAVGGDTFRPTLPTNATLVHASCSGGSALLVIDSTTSRVVAVEVVQVLP